MVHEALNELKMPNYAKTSGARGIHVYVPIVRGPTQKQVWYFAKEFARSVAAVRPQLMTTEYSVAKRPPRHVLVDYNQNAWGRTLAAVYSVRPRPRATVSTPVRWEEIERGIRVEDFRIDTVPGRISRDRRFVGAAVGTPRPLSARGVAVKLPIPTSFAPMEAELVGTVPVGDSWQDEPKWDGFRCLVFRVVEHAATKRASCGAKCAGSGCLWPTRVPTRRGGWLSSRFRRDLRQNA